MNKVKEDYKPERLKALQDFNKFVEEITVRKSKLLEELRGIEALIDQKKELYYGLIEKQDILDEKLHQMREEEKRLDLRVAYVEELERKQVELLHN